MEATLKTLKAQPAPTPHDTSQQTRPPARSKAAVPPSEDSAPPVHADFVDLPDDTSDEAQAPPPRPKKRRHAEVDGSQRPYFSARQFRCEQRQHGNVHSRQSVGGDERPPNPRRRPQASPSGFQAPPPHPILVTPIQSRNPSPDRVAILAPPSPAQHVPHDEPAAHKEAAPHEEPAPPPPASPYSQPHVQLDAPPPVTPETPRGERDLAFELRKEHEAFYLRTATAARGSVQMDVPKPPLRPVIQPPALFYLMSCGLLQFDIDRGKYEDFEAQIQEWKCTRNFMDMLFQAYGRFHSAS